VLFFEKGKRSLNDRSIPDILTAKRIFRGFPAEKPYLISEILIKQSSEEGALVCDPFCGSGSIGEAAIRNRRNFYGNDIWDEAVILSKHKLNAVGGIENTELKTISVTP
jgi:site-specific DNA-methyltransferase (adenine-specific)